MRTLTQEGQNQSAEGASVAREGLVFKVSDRIDRTSPRWARVMSLAFAQMGDAERARLSRMSVVWRSPMRLSWSERADAASKAQDVPWRSRMLYIYEFPPNVVDRMYQERVDELLLAAQMAAAQTAGQGVVNGQVGQLALPALPLPAGQLAVGGELPAEPLELPQPARG